MSKIFEHTDKGTSEGGREMKIIIHLCADIGSDSKPYADSGYNIIRVGKDIGVENFSFKDPVFGVIANPVCTEFSIASNFRKITDFEKGMFLVRHCQRIIKECNPEFWVIENPYSGRLKDVLGPPNYVYEPWEFGSPWTKKTALWGKFNHPKKKYTSWEEVPKNQNLYIKPGRNKPGMAHLHKNSIKYIPEFSCFQVKDDMSFRSLCSQNFAKAFFEENQ